MNDKPKRRLELILRLGADDMDTIISTFKQLMFDLDQIGERDYHSISGAPDAGYILDIAFSPNVDHEGYLTANEAYLKDLKND